MFGQLIKSHQINAENKISINFNDYSTGVYIVSIESSEEVEAFKVLYQ